MCSTKNSPTRERPKRAVTKKPPPELLVLTKPRRRPKPRKKPKYLSLKLALSAAELPSSPPLIAWMPPRSSKKKKKKRDPLLHDEDHRDKGNNGNNCQEQLHAEDQHHVALLFETATDGTSTALDGLLHSSSTSEERDPLSPSISCVYSYGIPDYKGRCGTDGLLRSAIRCKEREASVEERWVSYNEVVEAGALKRERDHEDEDTSSNCVTGTSRSSITEDNNGGDNNAWAKVQQLVGLKLDKYQDILDAWSDKPSFCFPPGKDPQEDHCLSLAQIVPDLHLPGLIDNQGSAENVWRVPDVKQDEKSKEKDQSWRTEQREASVLRYKEKRQNRLFSKQIRYEVRKVNAEKRPRLKGRFVKRNEGT